MGGTVPARTAIRYSRARVPGADVGVEEKWTRKFALLTFSPSLYYKYQSIKRVSAISRMSLFSDTGCDSSNEDDGIRQNSDLFTAN